jgi:hypothetical protein
MITYLKKKMRSNKIRFKPTISYLHVRIWQGQEFFVRIKFHLHFSGS